MSNANLSNAKITLDISLLNEFTEFLNAKANGEWPPKEPQYYCVEISGYETNANELAIIEKLPFANDTFYEHEFFDGMETVKMYANTLKSCADVCIINIYRARFSMGMLTKNGNLLETWERRLGNVNFERVI